MKKKKKLFFVMGRDRVKATKIISKKKRRLTMANER